jgi:hypothetical protein
LEPLESLFFVTNQQTKDKHSLNRKNKKSYQGPEEVFESKARLAVAHIPLLLAPRAHTSLDKGVE